VLEYPHLNPIPISALYIFEDSGLRIPRQILNGDSI